MEGVDSRRTPFFRGKIPWKIEVHLIFVLNGYMLFLHGPGTVLVAFVVKFYVQSQTDFPIYVDASKSFE